MESAIDIVKAQAVAKVEELRIAADKESIRARGEVDFSFFAGLCAPTIMRSVFPPFYLSLFKLLTQANATPEEILRFALGLPRGFAKTTFLKILVCWLICYKRNYFFLVVCATEGKALGFINDVDSILSSPNMEQVYGSWTQAKVTDNAKLKVANYQGESIFLQPAGISSAVRGANLNMRRPDCIICDDIQSREDAVSETVNEAQKDWFNATLLKAIESWGDHRRIIFLGNMYPGECILEMLRKNSQWISLITGAILDDGESLWPELRSIRSLVLEYKHDADNGRSHIWFAEVQNDPLNERYALLAKPIPPSPYEGLLDLPYESCFVTLDPAGYRKNSDDHVIAVHRVYDGHPVVVHMEGGVWNPEEAIANLIRLCTKWDANVAGIESVGYQQSLLFWADQAIAKAGLPIKVVEITAGNASKLSRIRDFIAELLSGESSMVISVSQVFSYWAHLYKIGKSNNRDDYLDAPAYQKQMLTKYSKEIFAPRDPAVQLSKLPDVVETDAGY
nr:MAG: terminase large subunit [Caudoviricetes sp.]